MALYQLPYLYIPAKNRPKCISFIDTFVRKKEPNV